MCKKCAGYAQLQTFSWCKRCQKRKIRHSALWRQRAIAWFLKQLRFSLHVDPNHARNHHYHTSSAHFGNRGNTASRPNAPSDARNTCSSNSMQVAFKIVPGHNKKLVCFICVGHAFPRFCGVSRAGIFKNVTFSNWSKCRKETQPQGDKCARRHNFVVFLYSAAKSLIKKDQISVFLRRKNDQTCENCLTKNDQNAHSLWTPFVWETRCFILAR